MEDMRDQGVILTPVKLDWLHANPYRDLERFPLDERKVEELMDSIRVTTLWPNIEARRVGDYHYEIAYGHHRVAAAERVLGGDTEVRILVREMTGEEMLVRMARENGETYNSLAVRVETIRQVLKYLYEHGEISMSTSGAWPVATVTDRVIAIAGGTDSSVSTVIGTINATIADPRMAASETMPAPMHATVFRQAVRSAEEDFDMKLTAGQVRSLAREVSDEGGVRRRDIRSLVRESFAGRVERPPHAPRIPDLTEKLDDAAAACRKVTEILAGLDDPVYQAAINDPLDDSAAHSSNQFKTDMHHAKVVLERWNDKLNFGRKPVEVTPRQTAIEA